MGVSKDTFFQYKEGRALSGYRSAWLVRDPELDKFCLIGATESVPYVFGDKESFEYDLLQADTKGSVEGKPTLESVDVEVLHHRDNAYRYNKLRGKTLDFMSINGEFVGYKFTGTLDYRPNTAEADVQKATVTITPMSASAEPLYNARHLIVETLAFANAIPESVKVGEKFSLAVRQASASVTVTVNKIADDTNAETPDVTNTNTTDISQVTISAEGLYAFTVSAVGYAPWTTTVYAYAN
jgi:hypothetical protein